MCLKSRQIGISHTTAGAATLWGIFLGETTTIISINLDTAGEVIEMALRHAKVLEKLGSTWAKCRRRGNSILFANGGRILAIPASSGGRGFSGNVFLDEFAYVEDPESLWDSATAIALHGYSKIRVSSTPNGVGNAFHKLWTDESQSKGWTKHRIDLRDAQAGGLDIRDAVCWSLAKGDQRIFNQMFLCSFLDGNEQYIPTELVQAAILDDTTVESGDWYAGYDVGLENDLSALVILRQTADNKVWVQSVTVGKRTDWQLQKQAVFAMFRNYDIKKLMVDESSIGSGFVNELQFILGRQKVQGLIFTLPSKEILATDMHQAFSSRMIKIPNDPGLIKDILSIRRIITTSGKVTYDAPHTVDGHADRAWALALAINAVSNKPGRRVEKGRGDFQNP